MKRIQTIIAIDPGDKSGWALLTVEAQPRLFGRGQADFKRGSGLTTGCIIGAAIELARNREFLQLPERVFIEDQFLGVNPKSLIKLCRNAGRWHEGAVSHGLKVSYTHPKTWISSELGRGLRHEQIVKSSLTKVEQLYQGLANLSEHEAAAILIGRHSAIEAWRAGLQLAV